MPEQVAHTMASLISDLGSVVTAVLGWVGNAVDTIVSNPFLLITTGVLMLGDFIYRLWKSFSVWQTGYTFVC